MSVIRDMGCVVHRVRQSRRIGLISGLHQQKNSCIAMPHQALQYYCHVICIPAHLNVPFPYIRFQLPPCMTFLCNALHLLST